jgi:hypothetical protein
MTAMGAAATEGQTKEEGGRTAGITAMGLRPARKQGRATGLRPARKGRATGLRRAWKGELLSFVGRVLFASIFLLSVYQEYVPPPPPPSICPLLGCF